MSCLDMSSAGLIGDVRSVLDAEMSFHSVIESSGCFCVSNSSRRGVQWFLMVGYMYVRTRVH